MAHTANHSVPEQWKFRRALASVGAFVQSLGSSSLGYTFDRIVGRALAAVCAFLRALEATSSTIRWIASTAWNRRSDD